MADEAVIDKDILLLTKQQEQLANELKRAYHQEIAREGNDGQKTVNRAKEMEERLRALSLDFTEQSEEVLDELKTVCLFSQFVNNLLCRNLSLINNIGIRANQNMNCRTFLRVCYELMRLMSLSCQEILIMILF